MNEDAHNLQGTAAVPPKHGEEGTPGVMNVAPTMMGLTWFVFAIVAALLYKLAWKPILKALDEREATIRQSLANAAKLRDELDKLEQQRREMLAEADRLTRPMVSTSASPSTVWSVPRSTSGRRGKSSTEYVWMRYVAAPAVTTTAASSGR